MGQQWVLVAPPGILVFQITCHLSSETVAKSLVAIRIVRKKTNQIGVQLLPKRVAKLRAFTKNVRKHATQLGVMFSVKMGVRISKMTQTLFLHLTFQEHMKFRSNFRLITS